MMEAESLGQMLAQAPGPTRLFGVVVGVVTNNKDDKGLGRVKVKFPWLSDSDESAWARVAVPMAGNQRGFYFLPEVNDEVLVAFEHGSADYPYVLGALWNGKDKPPEANDGGTNDIRAIKSRSGHIIRLNDKDGQEKVEIMDKTGRNSIVFDTAKNSLAISADSDITITSNNGKVSLSGQGVEIKSNAGVTIQAQSSADIKANGQLTIKGQMVNIN